MSDRELSCAERVAAQLKSREESLQALYERVADDNLSEEDQEEAQEEIDNFPLEVSTSVELKVLLSTGGPADYLTATIGRERDYSSRYGPGEWVRESDVVYHFADWFDHAEMPIDDGSPLVTMFDSYVELQGEVGE